MSIYIEYRANGTCMLIKYDTLYIHKKHTFCFLFNLHEIKPLYAEYSTKSSSNFNLYIFLILHEYRITQAIKYLR